ncbi:MAG: IS110 family transposase [Pseudomonadales bacterium]|nr:IS110 family transposase [Pseudomonadales bacterium]
MNKITRIGLDIAKNTFVLHAVNEQGKTVKRHTCDRAKVLSFFAGIEPCLVGIESCASSQHWAREIAQFGHTVKLMNPKFVVPYRKSGKNDANDAEAICEAVGRPNMRFVPVKSVEQQAVCSLHTSRQFLVVQRTALINHCRGVLAEFGIVMPVGADKVRRLLAEKLHKESEMIPVMLQALMQDHLDDLKRVEERIDSIDKQLAQWAKQNQQAINLQQMRGIGVITATAFASGVCDAKLFNNGRQFAAWLGLVPRQYSSGGKNKLGSITKTGDAYLRTMLTQGARSLVFHSKDKNDNFSLWIQRLIARIGMNKTVIAVAAKQARIMWAMMAKNIDYQAEKICSPLVA